MSLHKEKILKIQYDRLINDKKGTKEEILDFSINSLKRVKDRPNPIVGHFTQNQRVYRTTNSRYNMDNAPFILGFLDSEDKVVAIAEVKRKIPWEFDNYLYAYVFEALYEVENPFDANSVRNQGAFIYWEKGHKDKGDENLKDLFFEKLKNSGLRLILE